MRPAPFLIGGPHELTPPPYLIKLGCPGGRNSHDQPPAHTRPTGQLVEATW